MSKTIKEQWKQWVRSDEGEDLLSSIMYGWIALEMEDDLWGWLSAEVPSYRGLRWIMRKYLPEKFVNQTIRERIESGIEYLRNVIRDDYESLVGYMADNFEWEECPDCGELLTIQWNPELLTLEIVCDNCEETIKRAEEFGDNELRRLRRP